MQPQRERINKALWNLIEGIKDAATNGIAEAHKQQLKGLNEPDIVALTQIVKSIIDYGYNRGHSAFMRSVDQAIDEAVTSAVKSPRH